MPPPPAILLLANANTTQDKKERDRAVMSSPNTTQNKKDPDRAAASSPNTTQNKKDPDRAVASSPNTTQNKKDPDRAEASSPNTTQNKKDLDRAVASSPNTTQNKKDPDRAEASSPDTTQNKKDLDRAVASSPNTTENKKDLDRAVASSPNTTQNKKDPDLAVASSPNTTQNKKDPDLAVTSSQNTTQNNKDPDRAVSSSPNTTQNKKDLDQAVASSPNTTQNNKEPDQAVASRPKSNVTSETNGETMSQVKTYTVAAHAYDSDIDDDQDDDSGTVDEEDNHEDKEREAFIVEHLKDFPCTFNIGKANYNIEERVFAVETIKQMSCRGIVWESSLDDEIVSSNDDAWTPLEWTQNLRTRSYVEQGKLEEARRLIDEILNEPGRQTITATANLAVWYFVQGNVKDALEVVRQLNAMSKLKTFRHLKADALCEQAYFYYYFSGAENNMSGIEIVKFALNYLIKYKSEVTFMMGTMYRRCLHWSTYLFDKDKIDFVEFAKNAWEILSSVRNMEGVKSIVKANALVELAFLKNDVSVVQDVGSLNFDFSIEALCREAVELAPASANVTAIVGQLIKHIPRLNSWAKHLLETSIKINPSGRAHHHLA